MYTTLNVLIVTTDASYVATQVSGDSPLQAWTNALLWVARCEQHSDSYHITTASPVFIKQADLVMEQHTVGGCVREVNAPRKAR